MPYVHILSDDKPKQPGVYVVKDARYEDRYSYYDGYFRGVWKTAEEAWQNKLAPVALDLTFWHKPV